MGVTTGITLEFQFGTNWAYYSHYVGDIFGAPLAIERLMAFFLESTFIGLFFFGWDRLPKTQHLLKGRDVEFAKRSFRVASAFGLASVLPVIVLGDESGYTVGEAQQTKMAALEAM